MSRELKKKRLGNVRVKSMRSLAKKERQLNSKTIKDMIILLFGAFGLGTLLPTYIYSMSYLLNTYDLPKALLLAIFYSEIVIFILLRPYLTLLLELTRTAIGRRTPYLIVFGTLTAFLLTVVYSMIGNLTSASILLVVVFFFNFSVYVYTLALVGLFSDKQNYNYDNIIRFQSKMWFVIGALLSYAYSISTYKQKETVSYPAMIFLFSVFAVAFLIVEDKKYKIKLSPTEKTQIYESTKKNFVKLDISDLKNIFFKEGKNLSMLLNSYSFQYLLPLYVFFRTQDIFASAFAIFYYFLGSLFGLVITKFFQRIISVLENLTPMILVLTAALLVSIYLTTNISLIYLIVFFVAMLLEVTLKSVGKEVVKSNSLLTSTDRFQFLEDTRVCVNAANNLLLYLIIVLTGGLLDIFGSRISGVVLTVLILSNIIALKYSRVKIENKEKNKS
ncbi:MAG: hypothetical protein ACK4FU_01790 [Fervidobacterium gondwanense]